MINLICCIKSRESFSRIHKTFAGDKDFELEGFIENFEQVQADITIKQYDLAVVDEKLPWKDPVLDLFNKKDIKIIIFKGDYKKTISAIYKLSPKLEQSKGLHKTEDPQPEQKEAEPKKELTKKEPPTPEDKKLEEPVYKEIYKGIENKVIIITSLSKKAGSTFLSINLARALAGLKIRTSIIEPPIDRPYLYDYLGIAKKMETAGPGYNFYSYPHIINNGIKPLRDREPIIDDITWIIPDSNKKVIGNWDSLKMMKLLYASKKSPINIIDTGTNIGHASIDPVLSSADMILAVIDPMPVALKQNKDRLDMLLKLKKEGHPVEFVINFASSGINIKTLLDYLKKPPTIFIPAIDPQYIYKAAYRNKIPLDYPEVEEQLFKPLSRIIRNIIPPDLFKETLRDKTSFKDRNIIFRLKEKLFNLK